MYIWLLNNVRGRCYFYPQIHSSDNAPFFPSFLWLFDSNCYALLCVLGVISISISIIIIIIIIIIIVVIVIITIIYSLFPFNLPSPLTASSRTNDSDPSSDVDRLNELARQRTRRWGNDRHITPGFANSPAHYSPESQQESSFFFRRGFFEDRCQSRYVHMYMYICHIHV